MRPRIAIALLAGIIALSDPISVAQQDRPEVGRKLVSRVIPVYPDLARRLQLSGTVRVEAVVAPNGKVKSTHVVGGSPLLANAAVDAIEKWRWEPAPQESKELLELNFHPQ